MYAGGMGQDSWAIQGVAEVHVVQLTTDCLPHARYNSLCSPLWQVVGILQKHLLCPFCHLPGGSLTRPTIPA